MQQNAILWPQGFVPGTTENYCSNEVIVAGLSAAEIWPLLVTPALWPTYYANSAHPRFHDRRGPVLADGDRFCFETFGFPVEAQCKEYVAPVGGPAGQPGRVAWHGWVGESGATDRLDVHHAWLEEDLDGGRVRILTQETQTGAPAAELARARPNPMINGHQDWLDGLVAEARRRQATR